LRRTCMYASLLEMSGALYLGIFKQPANGGFFSNLLIRGFCLKEGREKRRTAYQETEEIMFKSEQNLREAFAGESQAYQRYLAYAQRAADEYKEGVYKLFHAVAASEKIHAQRHLSYLKGIQTTPENLKAAMAGEMHEFKTLYPKMIAEAKEEKQQGPEISFSHASEVEKVHHALFQKALENLDGFPAQDYFVCYACGYLAPGEAPEKCPVCGAVKKAFKKVE
jgi:rubrerythrin